MSNIKKKIAISHLNSFFIEIIIVTLFFAISCAINVQVFAKAFELNSKTDRMNKAILNAQSICEVFSSNHDLEKTLVTLYGNQVTPYLKLESLTMTIPLDSDWQVSSSNKKYVIKIKPEIESTDAGDIYYISVYVIQNNDTIYSAQTSSYSSVRGDRNG